MSEANTCIVEGQMYDAVTVEIPAPPHTLRCGDCDGKRDRVCNKLGPCTPVNGRVDGKTIEWRRRMARPAAAAEGQRA